MAVSRDIATTAKMRAGGAQCIVFPSFKKKKKIELAFKNKNLQVYPLLYNDIKLRRAFLYLPRVPLLLHISLTIVFQTLYKHLYLCFEPIHFLHCFCADAFEQRQTMRKSH